MRDRALQAAGNIPSTQAAAAAPPPSRNAGNADPRNSSLQKKHRDTGRGLKDLGRCREYEA
jgi:hypothetical protein